MKELSMEEKAKAYDEAIKKIQEIIIMDNVPVTPKEIGEYLFPQLKESDDEKIRKYLIDVVRDYVTGSEFEGCIAWLEKQKPLNEKKMYKAGYIDGFEDGVEDAVIEASEWSEEDEENLNQLHKLIVEKSYSDYEIDTEDETLYGKYATLDNWLKSLKERMKGE